MIREARHEDIADMVLVGKRLKNRIPGMEKLEVDPHMAVKAIRVAIQDKRQLALVSSTKRMDGILLAGLCQYDFFRSFYVSDSVFYCEDPTNAVKMLRWLVRWAFMFKQVYEISMGLSTGIKTSKVGQLYENLGFEKVGSFYTMKNPLWERR